MQLSLLYMKQQNFNLWSRYTHALALMWIDFLLRTHINKIVLTFILSVGCWRFLGTDLSCNIVMWWQVNICLLSRWNSLDIQCFEFSFTKGDFSLCLPSVRHQVLSHFYLNLIRIKPICIVNAFMDALQLAFYIFHHLGGKWLLILVITNSFLFPFSDHFFSVLILVRS